uniref:Tubulin--tyrosine ligase-like protein 8 n=1 Tax=Tetraselmis sp. GSL018 TaxID=582737 RepID=A0A061RUC1_9CHLO
MAEMGRIIAELQAGMPRVVQKYVERPLLLDRRKADLRVWVAVLRFEPLVAYMYEQVMVRPASQGFTLSRELLPNPAVHLCNHAVQCGLLAARRRRQRLSPGARSTSSPRPRPRARSPAPRARSAATSYRPGAPLDGSAGAGRPVVRGRHPGHA